MIAGMFTDIRYPQKRLKAPIVQLEPEADENTKRPANFVVLDSD
jgi:hypothetical protein